MNEPTHSNKSAAVFPVLLTDNQAAALLGVSVRTFHELRKQPWIPPAVVLGPRLLRWPRTEIEAAIVSMPRQTAPGEEPPQLKRRRLIENMKTNGVPA